MIHLRLHIYVLEILNLMAATCLSQVGTRSCLLLQDTIDIWKLRLGEDCCPTLA